MKEITLLKISELILDMDNPRFGELYTGSNREEDLIEYLLFNESAISIAERLSATKEFYVDKPLLVLKNNNKYIVKDGNRRCAAVKALLYPQKYKINLSKCEFSELPVVIYENKLDIENRIVEEHTNSMFREWDRIAKAIEIYRQFQSGSSIESMEEIDSKPVDLIKLASFYYEAVKIGGDDLKKLLRKGRGGTGGKTTIFERLFKYSDYFGYHFKNKPNYVIEIIDRKKFKKYINGIIQYLNKNPSTTYRDVDDKNKELFNKLGLPDFISNDKKIIHKDNSKKDSTNKKDASGDYSKSHKNKFQLYPQYNRIIPGPLKKVIDECYNLSELNFTNSKIAMSRVVFECCLKYVVEETKYNNKTLRDYAYFNDAFSYKTGKKSRWTNLKKLKELFENLIKNTGKAQAFKDFDLEKPHQIIHNYNIAGLVNDSRALCSNLIPLVEFMLDSESNFLSSIDIQKLK